MPAANAAGISANKERYGCKMERKNCWKQYSDKRLNKMEEYTKEYMHFLEEFGFLYHKLRNSLNSD